MPCGLCQALPQQTGVRQSYISSWRLLQQEQPGLFLSCFPCLCPSHLFVPWVIQELINSCLQCAWKLIKGKARQKKQFYFYSRLLAEFVSYGCAGVWVLFVLSTALQLSSRVCLCRPTALTQLFPCKWDSSVLPWSSSDSTKHLTATLIWFLVSLLFFSVANKVRSSINVFISVSASRSFQERMNWVSWWPLWCLCRSEMGISVSFMWLKYSLSLNQYPMSLWKLHWWSSQYISWKVGEQLA